MPGGDWQELKPSLLTSLRLPFALMRRSTLLSDCLQAFPRTPCRSSRGAAPSLADCSEPRGGRQQMCRAALRPRNTRVAQTC